MEKLKECYFILLQQCFYAINLFYCNQINQKTTVEYVDYEAQIVSLEKSINRYKEGIEDYKIQLSDCESHTDIYKQLFIGSPICDSRLSSSINIILKQLNLKVSKCNNEELGKISV